VVVLVGGCSASAAEAAGPEPAPSASVVRVMLPGFPSGVVLLAPPRRDSLPKVRAERNQRCDIHVPIGFAGPWQECAPGLVCNPTEAGPPNGRIGGACMEPVVQKEGEVCNLPSEDMDRIFVCAAGLRCEPVPGKHEGTCRR